MADVVPFGYSVRDKLFPGEDLYFNKNPGTAGMMVPETSDIIMNPYSQLSPEQRAAVVRNEAARLFMHQNKLSPTFEVSPTQAEKFKGTSYEKDPAALRATIAARIFSNDYSMFPQAAVTPEQLDFVQKFLTEKPK